MGTRANNLTPPEAILLVGHGTRNELGQQQFLKLAEHLRAAVAPLLVEVAFIELQAPTIQDALISLHTRGLKTILLSPALLIAAGHAKKDVPAAIELAKQQCPDLIVHSAEPLGCHPAILDLARIRFLDSLSSGLRDEGSNSSSSLAPVLRGEGFHSSYSLGSVLRGEGPAPRLASTTALVLIARGSSDHAAIAHCQLFATQLAERLGITNVFTGFIAIAQPSVSEALELAAASGAHQVIVQPHLLFEGDMLESVAAAAGTARRQFLNLQWYEARALGGDLLDIRSAAARYLIIALLSRLRASGLPTTVGTCDRIDQVFDDRGNFLPPTRIMSIGTELWRWSRACEPEQAAMIAPRSELALLLNYYLGSAFRCPNSAHSNEWWTDGVTGLQVSQSEPLAYRCVGAAYWSRQRRSAQLGFLLAPFEMEFHFSESETPIPGRAIVRFGMLDASGQIVESSHSTPGEQLIANRPTKNKDWAFAVELSPP